MRALTKRKILNEFSYVEKDESWTVEHSRSSEEALNCYPVEACYIPPFDTIWYSGFRSILPGK
jgi:hypothetical protein